MIEKALHKYGNDGLASLLRSTPPYLWDRLTFATKARLLESLSIDSDELAEYAGRHGRAWEYGEEVRFEISPPRTAPVPEEFEPLLGTHTCPPPFLLEVPSVKLTGPYGVCQLPDGRIVFEEMGTMMVLVERMSDTWNSFGGYRTARELLSDRVETDEPDYDVLINLIPRHGTSYRHVNYGHWLLEDLPRLRAFDFYREETGLRPGILLHGEPPSWMLETLRLLGFSSSDWVVSDRDTATVDRLLVPELPYVHGMGSKLRPAGRAWVSERMKSAVDRSSEREFSKYVYVSRQGQKQRSVYNYEETMDALGPMGFESYRPEELGIAEQIRLFDQAEIIVGAHGSGLTNMIYSTDATVVEIFPKNEIRTVFYAAANEFGHEYDYLVGENPPGISRAPTRNKDVVVDVDELVKMVEHAMSAKSRVPVIG